MLELEALKKMRHPQDQQPLRMLVGPQQKWQADLPAACPALPALLHHVTAVTADLDPCSSATSLQRNETETEALGAKGKAGNAALLGVT